MRRKNGLIAGWAVLVLAMVAGAAGSTERSDAIEQVRGALEQWVETRKVISREKQDWAFAQEMLKERIDLVEREIGELCIKTEEANKGITDTHKQLAKHLEENETLKSAGETLKEIVTGFEVQTLILVKRLPDPLQERIKPLTQRLPEKPEETKLSLSNRFMNVVGILNEVNKFNREITVTSEVRTLVDGQAAEVTALYVGLGQAYYTGANGSVAGVGRPTKDGWQWLPANASAETISDAIAILKGEKGAAFLPMPFEVQ